MTPTLRGTRTLLFVTAALGALSCGGGEVVGPPLDQSGTLQIQVDRAPANTGAVILTISGGPFQQEVISAGLTGRVTSPSSTERRMLIRGNIATGTLGYVMVPDVKVKYSVQLLEAAATKVGGYQVLDPGQFSIRLK